METLQSPAAIKQVHVVGGGTIEPVRSHLALAAPAFGSTARQLAALSEEYLPQMDTQLHLTRMADPESRLQTADDLEDLARSIVADYASKVVLWSPLVCDFAGQVGEEVGDKYGPRLDSREPQTIELEPRAKILSLFRKESLDGQKPRKDIFAVGFKTTVNAAPGDQYSAGLRLLKQNSLNLVVANDITTGKNMVVAPEETIYFESDERETTLRGLMEMVALRSQLTFTESTVVAGEPVPWDSELVYPTLRAVVEHCIEGGAYKEFLGVTAGHFAAKLGPREFLTSRRKTNFNDIANVGLVRVETDGDDKVIAYGSKPSVGGQSQRIVFEQHPGKDSIVHFHCPLKPGSQVPVVSQWEFECGSHQCGQNTSQGLGSFADGAIEAVYLDNHGPNIVFDHTTDPELVIAFIEANFDLSAKTGGYVPAS